MRSKTSIVSKKPNFLVSTALAIALSLPTLVTAQTPESNDYTARLRVMQQERLEAQTRRDNTLLDLAEADDKVENFECNKRELAVLQLLPEKATAIRTLENLEGRCANLAATPRNQNLREQCKALITERTELIERIDAYIASTEQMCKTTPSHNSGSN